MLFLKVRTDDVEASAAGDGDGLEVVYVDATGAGGDECDMISEVG